jgi:hypothetical protein
MAMLQPQFGRSHSEKSWIEPYSNYGAVAGVQ